MKICSFCKRKLLKEKFRIIKRNNWQGLYPQCKICESSLMKVKYEKNPIPQMLSNAKIRAKQKGVDFNLTSQYLKKIFPNFMRAIKNIFLYTFVSPNKEKVYLSLAEISGILNSILFRKSLYRPFKD